MASAMKHSLGRYVYGLAAIATGVCALVWHNYDALGHVPHRGTVIYILAVIEILAGIAILWPRTVRAGAAAMVAIYLLFALLAIPLILKHPLVYVYYGNFFEQFSYATAALILYACTSAVAPARTPRLAQIGYYLFAICVLSFAPEQLFYLSMTASLVPKWIPPGQMFWAIATSAAFALAGIALLTGFWALLASRLTAAMLLGFAFLVWLPALFANAHSFVNWSEALETVAIAASAWIVADFLSDRRSAESAAARLR